MIEYRIQITPTRTGEGLHIRTQAMMTPETTEELWAAAGPVLLILAQVLAGACQGLGTPAVDITKLPLGTTED